MDKLTLQVMDDTDKDGEQLHKFLLERMSIALPDSSLEYQRYKDYGEIMLGRANPQCNKAEKQKRKWREDVSGIIADYMMHYLEEELLRSMISKSNQYDAETTEIILSYCRQVENKGELATDPEQQGRQSGKRRQLLAQELAAYIDHERVLNLGGFFRFRPGRYRTELRDLLEYAVDEYLMDQQYKEFITLLQYFVYSQKPKIPVAHIMHKGGHEFMLLDEQLKPIETEHLDTTFRVEFLDKDYNLEDFIVSTLVTIAPERIYIHTRDQELPVIKTIMQIFESQAELCSYCSDCSPILDGMSHKTQP